MMGEHDTFSIVFPFFFGFLHRGRRWEDGMVGLEERSGIYTRKR